MMEPDYVWDFHQNCGELKVAGCPSQSRGSEWSVYVMTSKSLVHSIHICCINFSGQNDLYLIAINYLRTVFITADSKLEHQILFVKAAAAIVNNSKETRERNSPGSLCKNNFGSYWFRRSFINFIKCPLCQLFRPLPVCHS